MDKTMNYFFGRLSVHEDVMLNIIRKQKKTDASLKASVIVLGMMTVSNRAENKRLNRKINALNDEIKGIKNTMEE